MQYEADPRLQQPEIDSQETLSLEAQGGDFMLAKFSGKYQLHVNRSVMALLDEHRLLDAWDHWARHNRCPVATFYTDTITSSAAMRVLAHCVCLDILLLGRWTSLWCLTDGVRMEEAGILAAEWCCCPRAQPPSSCSSDSLSLERCHSCCAPDL
ncbi:hypothetical protein NQZ68_038642 [Dissostichus eleginoides]|nr:hypothetical protein NQZ68_038642 [Dissostichus eleginoides]